ncbi:MAG: ATP-binding cassette domain-containing protein [Prevotella sp.]|nr:ATP-binding cassette domain-containing protein [Prevotella sp.]
MKPVIRIHDGITRKEEWRMAEPVDFCLMNNEQLAIVGPNGGGKTMLVDIITGRHPLLPDRAEYNFGPGDEHLVSDNFKYIAFRDTYGGDNDRTYFLQQRWNQMEIDPETPTAGELLEEAFRLVGNDTPQRREWQQRIYQLFNMEHLLDKYIILLSSGELRKFKLASSLFTQPRVLILDNPFIGLDAETREQLKQLLQMLVSEQALQIVLVLSKTDDIPSFITHVVKVSGLIVQPKQTRSEYLQSREPLKPAVNPKAMRILSQEKRDALLSLPYNNKEYHAREVVRMNDVSIRYGQRTILSNLCWTVNNGERWALSGQNGSGKSTLLSLVCADNPQAYACDIVLFDQQRGSGETIWDIKKHIGYVSPEMHRAYQRDLPAIRIVASGLKDSVGLYVKPDEGDYDVCRWWMRLFGIEHLAERTFLKLSSGEQRLVLLARAFVKDPELLILDEPLHGLDDMNRQLVKDIIETFVERNNKTLIMVTHYQEELPRCITNRKELP